MNSPQRSRNKGGQRRRRSGGGQNRPQMPRGPVMTALGESTYEAVFDHGNEGYGIWFDGMVRDDPMYKQYWKGLGYRPIYVRIEEDQIVIQRDRPGGDDDQPEPGNDATLPDTDDAVAVVDADSGEIDEDADADDSGDADDDAADVVAEEEAPAPKKTRRSASRRRVVIDEEPADDVHVDED